MLSRIFSALKELVGKIPWNKVTQFLNWAADLAAEAVKKGTAAAEKILKYIKDNPGKIVDWFLKGYSVYDIIRMILG